jgi:hypothetical protein
VSERKMTQTKGQSHMAMVSGFRQRCKDNLVMERNSFQQMVLKKIEPLCQKKGIIISTHSSLLLQKIHPKWVLQNTNIKTTIKGRCVAQVVEHLPSKHRPWVQTAESSKENSSDVQKKIHQRVFVTWDLKVQATEEKVDTVVFVKIKNKHFQRSC